MTKGKAVASMCIRCLVERTTGPHPTSLRAGSPLRLATVGMTIHILVGLRVPNKNWQRRDLPFSQQLRDVDENTALPFVFSDGFIPCGWSKLRQNAG